MDRFQFATIVSWAGAQGLQGRKRLQKVIYFLQAAGCELDSHFSLHHYGPYSRSVADVCDEMVAEGLIEESKATNTVGSSYNYIMKPDTAAFLQQANLQQKNRAEMMARFKNLGAQLLVEDLWTLELGSTVLYFRSQNQTWEAALASACLFKNVKVENRQSQAAFDLAQYVSNFAAANSTT